MGKTREEQEGQVGEETSEETSEESTEDKIDLEEIMEEAFLQPGESADYLTKDQASKAIHRERQRAAQKKERELSEALGVSIDEARTIIAKHKEQEQANQSELERFQEENSGLQQENQTLKSQVQTMRLNSALERALRGEGIKEERIPYAIKLADTSGLEFTDDGKVKGIKDAVKGVKEASPEWFAGEQQETPVQQTRRGPAPTPPIPDSTQLTEQQRQQAQQESYSSVRSAF